MYDDDRAMMAEMTVEDARPAEQALNNQDKELAVLAEALDTLVHRLRPILLETGDTPGDRVLAERDAASPLVGRIIENNQRISTHRETVRTLIAHLEV